MKYECVVCGYSSNKKANVYRHLERKKRNCGNVYGEIREVREIRTTSEKNTVDCLLRKIEDLELEIEKLKNNSNNVNNINSNNITNITVVLNNYSETKLDKITDEDYINILTCDDYCEIIPNFIKLVHCNPDIPENRNIAITNRNKYNNDIAIVDEGKWMIRDRKMWVDSIIRDRNEDIKKWLNKKRKKISDENFTGYSIYDDNKEDKEIKKIVAGNSKNILYNHNKHLPAKIST